MHSRNILSCIGYMKDPREGVNLDGVPASVIERVETWDVDKCNCDKPLCDKCNGEKDASTRSLVKIEVPHIVFRPSFVEDIL